MYKNESRSIGPIQRSIVRGTPRHTGENNIRVFDTDGRGSLNEEMIKAIETIFGVIVNDDDLISLTFENYGNMKAVAQTISKREEMNRMVRN